MKNARGILESLKLFNKENKLQQLAVGAAAGATTGYIAFRVGKSVAFLVGGSILLFQVAQNHGLTKMSWGDARDKTKCITQSWKELACCWQQQATAYAKTNCSFGAGFVGGFLIGASMVR
ncbi:FUN14 family [Popillia japonica]|uniref:FUN14 family n=1 Tax=Popillia japonica TaxID=7064 RepID=A0AAW1N164_POPJA